MSAYYRRRWNDDPGGELESWGPSVWYFEVGPDGYALRQIEVYDTGPTLRYGPDRQEDDHGFLTYAPFEAGEWRPYEIGPEEFEEVWNDDHT